MYDHDAERTCDSIGISEERFEELIVGIVEDLYNILINFIGSQSEKNEKIEELISHLNDTETAFIIQEIVHRIEKLKFIPGFIVFNGKPSHIEPRKKIDDDISIV
jgi:hypothetical protein